MTWPIKDDLYVTGKTGLGIENPQERLEVDGKIKTTNLEASGTVQALTFQGDGSTLTGVVKNLDLAVKKAGDTMTGALTIQNNLTVSGSVNVDGDIQTTGKLSSQNGKVRRDFITWSTTQNTSTPIHIETNIPKKSDIMYRILVEGYNYGVGAVINSDVVGYTYNGWDNIGQDQINNYASGVSISQYYSSKGFVVIKLETSRTYYLGFSASAWFTNPTGTGFDISAQVYQQAGNV